MLIFSEFQLHSWFVFFNYLYLLGCSCSVSLSFAIAQLYCFWPFIWDHKCATFISSCRADIYFGVSVCVNAGKLALKVHRGYEGEKNVIGLSVKLYKIFFRCV